VRGEGERDRILEDLLIESGDLFIGAIPERDCRLCSFSAGAKVRGVLAGNDRKMTARKQQMEAETASRETGSTNPNKKQRATENGSEKRVPKDGAEQLRQAADKRLSLNSEALADLLEKDALAGNLSSLKELVLLAERKKPRPAPVKKPRRPNMALQLAAEPKWQDEEQETGNRE
jgi:hypothetical protein